MENISPTLAFAYCVRRNLKSGRSVSYSIDEYVRKNQNLLSKKLLEMLNARNQGGCKPDLGDCLSIHSENILNMVWSALSGKSIQKNLDQFIRYYEKYCGNEIEGHLAKLPFKLLLPLLFLQFPAFLILLFGPIMHAFQVAL